MSGWLKSAVKETRKESAGSRRASLSPSRTSTARSMTTKRRPVRCTWTPASLIMQMKGAAEPSRTGISGPSTSTRQLSIPIPTSAAITCSTVETRAAPTPTVVLSLVSTTFPLVAGISTPRSMRTNATPASAGAGASVNVTGWPECRPIPVAVTRFATVL